MSKIVGIDLGTSNSCVALLEGGKPEVIFNTLGGRLTPSVVRISNSSDVIVGEHALRSSSLHPEETITGIKRFIGRRYNEIADIADMVAFKVALGKNNLATVQVKEIQYSPQQISAMILKSLKEAAEFYLGAKVEKAVITIPAYFNNNQRQATKEAGLMAGLEVVRLINEPNAAALVYGLDITKDETIAVFDLGGGTFDVSILEVGEGVVEVKSISGDGFLGGDDFDERIVKWIVDEIYIEENIDVTLNLHAMQRIRTEATKVKCELSSLPEVLINLPYLIETTNGYLNFEKKITRSKFEQICEELFQRLTLPCEIVLLNAGLSPKDINRILLIGGATRMPKIEYIVRQIFGKEPSKSINPDEAVALGAAIQAGILNGEKTDILLLDMTPNALSIEIADGKTCSFIPASTTIPTRKSEIFSTLFDNQSSVEIHVLEGDESWAINNRSLGRFILEGIQPALKGVPQIEITFDIDSNNILIVEAKDINTGRNNRINIKAFTGLEQTDITTIAQNVSLTPNYLESE